MDGKRSKNERGQCRQARENSKEKTIDCVGYLCMEERENVEHLLEECTELKERKENKRKRGGKKKGMAGKKIFI